MPKHSWLIALTLPALSLVGCSEGGSSPQATAASASGRAATSATATSRATTAASASAAADPGATGAKALPAEPAPTVVQIDWAAMQWKDLKAGKTVELVDTDLGTCGLAGWHLPLPKGVLLAALSTAQGKGCSAKNFPGPPGTQLMVVVGGPPLAVKDVKNVKAVTFEAPDGYLVELDTKGTPPFYPRVERTVAGEATSCSLTYVDFDTARSAYEICRKLDKAAAAKP